MTVVESQADLLSLSFEAKGWLVDKEIRQILFAEDISLLPVEDQQTYYAMAGAWFDLYEFVFLGYERGVLSDEQLRIWKTGMCNLPGGFFDAFGEHIPESMFLETLVTAVKECSPSPLDK